MNVKTRAKSDDNEAKIHEIVVNHVCLNPEGNFYIKDNDGSTDLCCLTIALINVVLDLHIELA